MKYDEKKVLKSPADMDTGTEMQSTQGHYYYNIIHKEMEDVLKKESEDPRHAIKKLCTVVAQQLDGMTKDQETEKKLAKKDSEILKHSIVNEITNVIDKKVNNLQDDFKTTKRWMIGTMVSVSALIVTIFAASSGFLTQVFGG